MKEEYTPEELENVIKSLSVAKKDGVKLAHRGDTVFIRFNKPVDAQEAQYWAKKISQQSKLNIVFIDNSMKVDLNGDTVVSYIIEQINTLEAASKDTKLSIDDVVKMLTYIISIYSNERKDGGE